MGGGGGGSSGGTGSDSAWAGGGGGGSGALEKITIPATSGQVIDFTIDWSWRSFYLWYWKNWNNSWTSHFYL